MDDPRPASIHSLARRGASGLTGQPAKARRAHIHARMRPEDAFRTTLSDCLAQMTANAGALRPNNLAEGHAVEALHQLRVGLRRLEVALQCFGAAFGQPWLEELRGRAKVLSSRLGPARDLDVFVEELLAAPARAGWDEGDKEVLAALRALAEQARGAAWGRALACIAGADFALFLDDVAALAGSRLPLVRGGESLPPLAARMLARRASHARKCARKARSRKEGDLHRLRIALKKLRYTAEFLSPLYKTGKVRRYLKRVRRLQDGLGRLNDIAHARAVLTELVPRAQEGSGDVRFAAGLVQGWYRARRARLVRKTLKRWDRFGAIKPFWD